MFKNLLRVYNKNDEYANYHKCYFLIMPDEYDPTNDYHFYDYLLPRLCQLTKLQWQDYTSYFEGTADIEENEMFWSAITNYELYECKIHINRVNITGNYDLPNYMIR